MVDLDLMPEQHEIRDTVREFVSHEIRPVATKSSRLEALDRRPPLDLLVKASQLGLRTLALSETLGGAGADGITACIVAEELAVGDPDIAAVLVETSALSRSLFDELMTSAQRERWLPQFLRDDAVQLALAAHEAEIDNELGVNYHRAVSVAPAIRCTAARSPAGDWIINGAKSFVPNAPLASLILVLVKTDPKAAAGEGIATLLVPRDTPGMTVRELDQNAGWYHGLRGEVTFTDCRVPADHLLGTQNRRFTAAGLDAIGVGAPVRAAMNIGVGRAAYEAALDYAKLRMQGGRRLIEHQAIGTLLAEIASRIEIARTMVWKAAWAADQSSTQAERSVSDLPLDTIARVYTAEAMRQATLDAAEVFGAMGVMRDMPLQKYVQDALVFLHSGMNPGDGKLRIAEALAQFRRP